jgi:hypothetical protein
VNAPVPGAGTLRRVDNSNLGPPDQDAYGVIGDDGRYALLITPATAFLLWQVLDQWRSGRVGRPPLDGAEAMPILILTAALDEMVGPPERRLTDDAVGQLRLDFEPDGLPPAG